MVLLLTQCFGRENLCLITKEMRYNYFILIHKSIQFGKPSLTSYHCYHWPFSLLSPVSHEGASGSGNEFCSTVYISPFKLAAVSENSSDNKKVISMVNQALQSGCSTQLSMKFPAHTEIQTTVEF